MRSLYYQLMHIAIIGKAFSGLTNYVTKNDHTYILFKDAKRVPTNPKENTVYIDFSNEQNVINSVAESHKKQTFDATLTIFEQYIVFNAKLADALGLPGLGVDAAHACTDKSIMRTAPKKISPDFQLINSLDDLESFAATHHFPLILKPANLAKSLLVTKNHDLSELKANYERMLGRMDDVYRKYAPHNKQLILIEEFLEGSIHSVDAYVDAAGTPTILPFIVDYQTGYDIGYDDNFHYSRLLPSVLSAETQQDFLETAEIAIRALGMKNSAAHVEIIVTKDGPRVVEIGARNGGYRERMHAAAHGIDIYKNALLTIARLPLQLDATKNEPCAVLELFPRNAGKFSHLENESILRTLASLEYLSIKYKPGELTGKSSDGYKAACVIMLHHKDPNQFKQDLGFVNNNVFVVTD